MMKKTNLRKKRLNKLSPLLKIPLIFLLSSKIKGALPKIEKSKKASHHHVQYNLCQLLDSEKDICLQCVTGYFTENGRCIKCPNYCEKCDKGGCHRCHIGSFLEGNRCLPCHKSCFSCTTFDKCDDCAPLYNNVDGKCVDHFENNPDMLWKIFVYFGLVFMIFFVCGKFLIQGVEEIKFKDEREEEEGEGDGGVFWDDDEEERAKIRGGDVTRSSEGGGEE